jgi:histidine ammonia-lyase
VTFGPHDALPFISSNAATLADAALAGVDLERLARAAVVVAGLTFCALGGNAEAFDPVVERVSPFDGARQVCRWMRVLTAVPGERAVPRRIQDPYGLRALPQVHGSLLDALAWLATVVERMAGAPSENPVVLADEPSSRLGAGIAHHGGFHAASLATALDTARSAAVQAGQLVLARVSSLCRPELTGLAAFLGDGTAGASGIMVLEYVVTAALADLRALAAPVAVGTASLSLGAEDDASFAATGARQAAEAAQALEILLSGELVAAVRAIRLSGQTVPAPLLARAMDLCAGLPADLADRDLSPDLDAAAALLPGLADLIEPGAQPI